MSFAPAIFKCFHKLNLFFYFIILVEFGHFEMLWISLMFLVLMTPCLNFGFFSSFDLVLEIVWFVWFMIFYFFRIFSQTFLVLF